MKKFCVCAMMLTYALAAGGVHFAGAQETKTGEGALIGGLLGAVAGGAIGNKSHKTAQGALIGGAVGALGGAVVGSQMKSAPAATPATTTSPVATPAAATTKVTIKQIIYWTEQGLPGDEIITRIDKSDAVFELTEDDVAYLQKEKVSQRVIEAMQEKK